MVMHVYAIHIAKLLLYSQSHYVPGWWFSQAGRIIPYIMETKKCSKPPTRYCIWGDFASVNHHKSLF